MKENSILLMKRKDTWYWDGYYWVPAGHVEKWESFTTATIREAKEEIGIDLTKEQLKVVHVQHKKQNNANNERIHVYLLATERTWEITNNEQWKCEEIHWFDINKLPENTLDCQKAALNEIKKWVFYSEFWW